MANPNRTVWNFRHRKFVCVAEQVFPTHAAADEWIATQEGERKRVTPFKTGPNAAPIVQFAARVYARAK